MKKKILAKNANWVLLVREHVSGYEKSIFGKANNSGDIFRLVRDRILAEQVEVMYVLCLNGQNQVTYLHEVSRGGLHGCAVSARDIYRVACASAASAIVLVHNHPSGDPTPSEEDIQMTDKVAEAGDILGIPLLDHVVVGGYEKYRSVIY